MDIVEFEKRIMLNGGYDRAFGNWRIIDVHIIPTLLSETNEVDFYCCNNIRVYLLRLRNRNKEMLDATPESNGYPAYLIAELPIVDIDNAFLEHVLSKFDLK